MSEQKPVKPVVDAQVGEAERGAEARSVGEAAQARVAVETTRVQAVGASDAKAADVEARKAPAAERPDGPADAPARKPAQTPAAGKGAGKPTKPKRSGKAAQRARAMRVHRIVRWCVQIAFFVLAPSIFSATFNGVKYMATQIGLGQAVEPTSFVALLIAVLGFTVLFGRFFCGYACAFGTLGDAVYLLFTPVRKLLGIPDRPLSGKAQRAGQYVKFAVLAAIVLMCFFGVWAEVSGYSPWTAFAGIVALSVDGIDAAAFIVLGVLVLGMGFVKRFFCQFLCPLGAAFALMPVLPFSAFSRKKACCSQRCGQCCAGCPVSVFPDADSFTAGECISCGKCADVCPIGNAGLLRAKATGELRVGKPPKRILRGNEVWLVLLKAALLLAVLWVAGALGNVPTFTEATGISLPWG